MRIVLTHPYCWPYVRRGAERHLADLAAYLDNRGHEVVLLSSRPRNSVGSDGGTPRQLLVKQPWVPTFLRQRITPLQTFFLSSLRRLPGLRADVVHSLYFSDGLAACLTKRFAGHRTVLQLNGPPIPSSFSRWLPPDRWALRQAIRRSDRVVAISQFVANTVRDNYGVEPLVWPVPIRIERFPLGHGPPDDRPVLLAVADFNSRRKGVRVLIRAFEQLLREIPDARLRLSGNLSPELRSELLDPLSPSTQAAIDVLGIGELDDLPKLYQTSSVLVMPSMWEAAGMVMFEAWSSGTPVVATRHGGIPEFVTTETGVLFDPEPYGEETNNVEGLLEALRKGLDLWREPGIRQRCREHAERYAWNVLGPQLESLYDG